MGLDKLCHSVFHVDMTNKGKAPKLVGRKCTFEYRIGSALIDRWRFCSSWFVVCLPQSQLVRMTLNTYETLQRFDQRRISDNDLAVRRCPFKESPKIPFRWVLEFGRRKALSKIYEKYKLMMQSFEHDMKISLTLA